MIFRIEHLNERFNESTDSIIKGNKHVQANPRVIESSKSNSPKHIKVLRKLKVI